MFNAQIAYGLLIPFLGTLLGSACVFFMKKQMGLMLERILEAFAAGVMVAASVWSLLIPSLEHAASKGTWAFVPAAVGFWAGILLLLLLDEAIPHLHPDLADPEPSRRPSCSSSRSHSTTSPKAWPSVSFWPAGPAATWASR